MPAYLQGKTLCSIIHQGFSGKSYENLSTASTIASRKNRNTVKTPVPSHLYRSHPQPFTHFDMKPLSPRMFTPKLYNPNQNVGEMFPGRTSSAASTSRSIAAASGGENVHPVPFPKSSAQNMATSFKRLLHTVGWFDEAARLIQACFAACNLFWLEIKRSGTGCASISGFFCSCIQPAGACGSCIRP